MDKERVKEILDKLQICIKGMCSLCEYRQSCMDGLIDDCYDVLGEVYNDIEGKN